jgi:hypothetical protein
LFFLTQFSIILCLCPEKTIRTSWLSLASHWDSEWYEAIANNGYLNLDGPAHSGLQNANVVFFPGYPYFARLLKVCFGLNTKAALLTISEGAALLFWCLFFHITRLAKRYQQLCAALLVGTFPTSWFLYMGYSESLFIFHCCLMLWFVTQKKWAFSVQ